MLTVFLNNNTIVQKVFLFAYRIGGGLNFGGNFAFLKSMPYIMKKRKIYLCRVKIQGTLSEANLAKQLET